MFLKKCFFLVLMDEIKRYCYVGYIRYRFIFMIGYYLYWLLLIIDDQRGGFILYIDNGIILYGFDIYKYLQK